MNFNVAQNLKKFFVIKKFNLENLNIVSKDSGAFDVTFKVHTPSELNTLNFNCNLIKDNSNSMLMRNKLVSRINSSNYTVLNFFCNKR